MKADQHLSGALRATITRAGKSIGHGAALCLLLLASALHPDHAQAQAPDGEQPPLFVDVDPQANMRHEKARAAYEKGHDALAAERTDLALAQFESACANGDPKSCFNVATLVTQTLDTQPAGTHPDPARIAAITRALGAACDRGFQRGCASLVRYIRSSDYGMQDLAKAVSLAQTACAAGEAIACDHLAEMYYAGDGVPADRARSAALFRQSCDAGGPASSCFNYAIMLDKRQVEEFAPAKALEYYRTGCRAGSDEACINLAAEYLDGNRVAGSVDIAEGLLRQSCERGALTACSTLGSLLVDYRRSPEARLAAVGFYRKACDGGVGTGCRGLGNLAQDGIRQAGSPRDAIRQFIMGCDLGASSSCYNVGLMYWIGFKAPKRPDLALGWFAKGCDLKSASSCAGAAIASYSAKPQPREAAMSQSRLWNNYALSLDAGNPLALAIDEWLDDGAAPDAAPVIPSSAAPVSPAQTPEA